MQAVGDGETTGEHPTRTATTTNAKKRGATPEGTADELPSGCCESRDAGPPCPRRISPPVAASRRPGSAGDSTVGSWASHDAAVKTTFAGEKGEHPAVITLGSTRVRNAGSAKGPPMSPGHCLARTVS
jgi:hypothetical protein